MVTGTAQILGETGPVGSLALKQRLQRVGRRRRIRALLLVLPLLLFLIVTFVVPIGNLLFKSVYDPDLSKLLPETGLAIRDWDGQDLPSEDVFAAFAADLKSAHQTKNSGLVGKRLNYELGGIRSVVLKTGRELSKVEPATTVKMPRSKNIALGRCSSPNTGTVKWAVWVVRNG